MLELQALRARPAAMTVRSRSAVFFMVWCRVYLISVPDSAEHSAFHSIDISRISRIFREVMDRETEGWRGKAAVP